MIQDPGAPFRRNPRQVAEDFNKTDPALNRPDTMSGVFQPAFTTEFDTPGMSASEQGAMETLGDVEQQNVQLAEQGVSLANAAEAARQRMAQRSFGFQDPQSQQPQQSQQSGTTSGQMNQAYRPSGNVSPTRQQILQETSRYAGTPYQFGGRTVKGIDCSGLVMSVYNSLGFNIQSHSVSGQARTIPGAKTAVSNLKPGDLVVWNDNSHIAVYAGNGQIWDASPSKGTSLRPLWAPQNQVYGIAVRLPGE
jgi:cell wall-associated NlpC family hydrolase